MTDKQPGPVTYTDRLLNDFATRSFRDIADQDYIAARLAYRHQLFAQFLWSSQQAIEKLLKCILLQNRIKACDIRHDLAKGLERVEGGMPYAISLTPRTREFINYVDSVGRWRYLEVSYHVIGHRIIDLDRAIWEIRRYAELHDYWISNGKNGLVHMLPDGIEKLNRSDDQDAIAFPGIDGGLLEKILADHKSPARGPLIWQNAFFGSRRRATITLRGHLHTVNAPLTLHPEILDEVRQYVYVPDKVAAAYREHLRKTQGNTETQ